LVTTAVPSVSCALTDGIWGYLRLSTGEIVWQVCRAHSLPTLLLRCVVGCLGQGTRSLLHSLLFAFSAAWLLLIASRLSLKRRSLSKDRQNLRQHQILTITVFTVARYSTNTEESTGINALLIPTNCSFAQALGRGRLDIYSAASQCTITVYLDQNFLSLLFHTTLSQQYVVGSTVCFPVLLSERALRLRWLRRDWRQSVSL
jgi:hypothetical protein